VFFSQKRGFPLQAGGSPAILAAKTWQYILKYGWCWGSFCFCCYFSAIVSFGDHWRFFRSGIFHCGASAFLPLQSTVVVLAIFSAATYPTTSHRRFALRTHFFASFSPTISLHYILADPLSASQQESLS
jgi:hypothetical protein